MSFFRRLIQFAVVLGAVAISLSPAHAAQRPEDILTATPEETAMCSRKVYGGRDRDFKVKTEGQANWLNMHHYCDCLRFRDRAVRSLGNKEAVRGNIRVAVGGCDYVIERATPNFNMLPQIHLDKGRALQVGGDLAGAAQEYLRVIQMKPAMAEAYWELSSLQILRGNKVEALETVTLGLRNSEGSAALRKRYVELGGKPPIPEQIGKRDDPVKVAPDVQGNGKSATREEDDSLAVKTDSTSGTSNDMTLPQGCRFCPPDEIQKRWRESFGEPSKQLQ